MDDALTAKDLLLLGGVLVSPLVVLGELLLFRRVLGQHRRPPLWAAGMAVVGGGIAAYAVLGIHAALAARSAVPVLAGLARSLAPEWSVLWTPAIEEAAKAAALLPVLIARRPDEIDGLFYGTAAGFGFAIAENHRFFMAAPRVALLVELLWSRTIGAPLTHGLATGAVGASIGWMRRGRSWPHRLALPILGGAVALGWHASWNAMVHWGRPGDGSYPALFAAQILAALVVAWLVRRSVRRTAASAMGDA